MKTAKSILGVVLFSLFSFCCPALYADCTTSFSCTNNTQENLVPNPGFECYTSCPDNQAEINRAFPWFQPTQGTPDYLNACATISSSVEVPNSVFGYAIAHGGVAYAGEIVYESDGLYREYIETPLVSPLVAGHTYAVSFYVCLASYVSDYAVDNLGAYLSVNPVTAPSSYLNLPVTPQVQNTTGYITSTTSWTLIQGTYTATGGESFLTLGNFHDDASTTTVPAGSGGDDYAYYFIDDVSVMDTSACSNGCASTNGCITISNPDNIVVFTCSNSLPVDYIVGVLDGCCSGCVTLNSVPPSGYDFPLGTTTVTSTATDTLGNTDSCSFTVTVIQRTNSPPVIISYPSPLVVPTLCGSNCAVMPDETSEVVATNSFGVNAYVAQSIAPGTVLCSNANITFTASDDCGNATNVTVPVIVICDCPITFHCESDITVASCTNVPVFYYPTATDCCSNELQVVCDPTNGTYFAPGTTNTVQCMASNGCSTNTCSFTVTVLQNTNALTFNCPSNITVVSCTNVPVTYPPLSVTNPCCTNGSITVMYYPTNDTYFIPGTTSNVTCTVFDGCGDFSNCTFQVTVADPCAQQISGVITIASVNISNFIVINWSNTSPYNWHLQVSTNIIDWSNFSTNVISPYLVQPTGPAQFYRLMGAMTN